MVSAHQPFKRLLNTLMRAPDFRKCDLKVTLERMLKSTFKSAIKGSLKSTFKEADMAHMIHAGVTASVTELKRNPMGTIAAGQGGTVAILNRNEPAFYCVPTAEYEAMLAMIEDAELNAIADARASSREIAVSLDEL